MNPIMTSRLAALLVTALAAAPLVAQAHEQITGASDFVKEPGGTVLGRLVNGAQVQTGSAKGSAVEITIDAWIVASALREDHREGFDVSVNLADGTSLRASPGTGAVQGTARAGALFNRVENKSGWVHVRRKAWIPRAALAAPKPTPPPPPPAQVVTPPPPPPAPPAENGAMTMLSGGTTLATVPSGSAMGTFEVPVKAEVLERRAGWAHVRIDGWVREGSLGEAPPPGSITAADLRNQPDRYVGQTVEWTLQVIAVQKADDLRPELPLGQPYVLARGPLPESGFVYLVIALDQEAQFRGLQPLTKVRVRATVRAGRSKYLPVPVLNFVRRLD